VKERGRYLGANLREQSQLILLLALIAVLSIINPHFRTIGNLVNLLRQISVIAIISCGMTLVLLSGCLDLSVGSVFSFLNLLAISFQQKSNILGVVIPLIVAVAIGLFNGLIVTVFNVNSIIVTLGSLSLFSGMALLYSNGAIIFGVSDTWFSLIGKNELLGIPIHILIFLFIAVFYQLLLSKTRFGRKVVYIGTNLEASEIAGIRSKRVRTSLFVMSGLSVAIAALIYSSRMGTASPVTGVGFEFSALTAVVIGGTSLLGGKGSIARTVIGVLMLAVLVNAMILYNIPFSFQNITKGILIIVALVADIAARNRVARAVQKMQVVSAT
jgi:ribose/xylose/arabinose/galactoside ABC-type transport system permease subunit